MAFNFRFRLRELGTTCTLQRDLSIYQQEIRTHIEMKFENGTRMVNAAGGFNCPLDHLHFKAGNGNICQIANCILNPLTAVPATVVNLLTIISIWRTPSLHTPSNILLLNLALSDFFVGLVAQPTFQVFLVADIRDLPDAYCSSALAHNVAAYATSGASFLILTAISIDRFTAIYLHLRYQEIVTVKRVIWGLILIWSTPLLASSTILWWGKSFIDFFALVSVHICIFINFVCYSMIYTVARRHRRKIWSQCWATHTGQKMQDFAKLAKSSWNMFLINLTSLLCYVSIFVAKLVIQITGSNSPSKECFREVAVLIVFTNSLLNPILYCWRFRQIRLAISRTAREIFRKPCTNLDQQQLPEVTTHSKSL